MSEDTTEPKAPSNILEGLFIKNKNPNDSAAEPIFKHQNWDYDSSTSTPRRQVETSELPTQEAISKHEFVTGCLKPFLYWLEAGGQDFRKKTPQEWNEQYVQYCQTQLPDIG